MRGTGRGKRKVGKVTRNEAFFATVLLSVCPSAAARANSFPPIPPLPPCVLYHGGTLDLLKMHCGIERGILSYTAIFPTQGLHYVPTLSATLGKRGIRNYYYSVAVAPRFPKRETAFFAVKKKHRLFFRESVSRVVSPCFPRSVSFLLIGEAAAISCPVFFLLSFSFFFLFPSWEIRGEEEGEETLLQ